MNIKQLETFLKVAETRNYTEAAKQLYISQTAITKQIQKLEEDLNTKLFIRTNKSVKLTAEGQFFLKEAEDILHRIDVSKQHLQSFKRGEAGEIRIGCMKTLDSEKLYEVIKAFEMRYPNVKVTLKKEHTTVLNQQLQDGLLDMIINIDLDMPFEKVLFDSYKVIEIRGLEYTGNHVVYDCRNDQDIMEMSAIDDVLMNVIANKGIGYIHEFVLSASKRKYLKVSTVKREQSERKVYMMYNPEITHPTVSLFIRQYHQAELR